MSDVLLYRVRQMNNKCVPTTTTTTTTNSPTLIISHQELYITHATDLYREV